MNSEHLPDSAQVVVIGGGIIGCSVAYHLATMGMTEVVLLERDQLTSGTTWHAAGLHTTYGSTSETKTELRKYSGELYRALEAETGQSTGYKTIGFIELASNQDRLYEFRKVAAFNRLLGIDVHEITPSEVKELFPYARVDDLRAGFYVEGDGRVNPIDATMALAKGARQKGVRVIEKTAVNGIESRNGTVTAVKTKTGTIHTEYVVNCAGMWARQLGELSGVTIPLQAAEHYYLITDDIKGMPEDLPVIEDPESYGYYRPEGKGMMVGLFEPLCAPWKVEGIPADFSFSDIPPDWDRMEDFLAVAMNRVPITLETGIKKFFCGPESFTPDLAPIVGEAPELRNYFVCAGLNSLGITTGPGLGRLLAHWIINGTPDMDVTEMNIDRFHPYQNNPEYRRQRSIESLGLVYKCHYPSRNPETARDAKRSPFHDRLIDQRAYFRDVSGWESPSWYAPAGEQPEILQHSFGRENWFPWWEAEHTACRENVILMDMTFMSKFLVVGPDAGRALNYISANKVDGNCETITYTQWLNHDGKLEADLTVIKMTDSEFMVVATDTMHRHVETWLKRNIPNNAQAVVVDVTARYGQLNIQGPNSRALLQSITSNDLSNEAFPFRAAREIDIGYAKVLCVRITYLGELGYELNIPSEQAVHVYDRIVAAGKPFGLQHAGLSALASLRMEKGYRDYGHDIDNTDDPYETGLGFAVDLKSEREFIGKQACIAKKERTPYKRRLLQILVNDPQPLMCHAEVVYRNGKAVGYIRAASYGFTLGGAVGLAMVEDSIPINKEYIHSGMWEVDIAGKRYSASASLRPLYDPTMARIKV